MLAAFTAPSLFAIFYMAALTIWPTRHPRAYSEAYVAVSVVTTYCVAALAARRGRCNGGQLVGALLLSAAAALLGCVAAAHLGHR